MLCSSKEITGYGIAARDGDIGQISDVHFDDARWVIRHLVVATGGWLSGRDVLISPHAVEHVDRGARQVRLNLSREQIEGAPSIDTDQPVSRQHESSYYDYYGYPYYWGGPGLWGGAAYPLGAWAAATPGRDTGMPEEVAAIARAEHESGDPHLRSSREVIGYHIEASDGSIGHINDFLFDERSWAIHYAVIDTHNWLPDRLVLVTPRTIESVDWAGSKVHVKLTRHAVEASPSYERSASLSKEDHEHIQRYFAGWS